MAVKGDLYGYVDSKGKVVLDITIPYSEGAINWGMFNSKMLARVIVEEKFGLIDTSGNRFVPALFEDIGEVSSELIAIKRHGKWGYCDYETKLKIPYNFDYASGFVNGLAFVKVEDKYGLIDDKGSYVIEPQYESIEWFKEGVLMVQMEGNYGLIDKDQKEVLPIQYTKVETTKDNKYLRLYSEKGFSYKALIPF